MGCPFLVGGRLKGSARETGERVKNAHFYGMFLMDAPEGRGRVSKYYYSLFLYRKYVILQRKYVGKWLVSRKRKLPLM